MLKPTLYLFVGYPGAGKTTVARIIENLTGAVHIWADHERQAMFGHPVHSPAENQQLYEHLNERTRQLLAEGNSVIFDTNFNFVKDRRFLSEIADDNDAEVAVVWITTPKPLAKQRAVFESEGKDTRLFGNMAEADFERIAGHLEPPDKDEKVIKIDGTNIDEAVVKQLLQL